ncbi:carboxypeptidase-like regulatory domain-containing protein [Bacteroides acidifaciens]|uniref:carboxypeptidase-like regulatory domain-containing protein n=1 Tax=Bacteroides acidifaciens TaxID=85831 RepID=UPI002557D34C|nr:carboxypeptidase-like regulatory domain-containing protein [Bacteroides acidifaciens]
MRIYFTLLFTIIISLSVFAKNIITGTVADASDRSPIVGANVLIKDSNGKMLTYGISDDGGRFSIETPDGVENLYIQVTMIGYKTFSAPCKANAQPWTIFMEDGALQLQEVVVKAARIRENGDTITYNVGSFAQKQDRTIGDVLKRMPGIDVANNGKIKYQGTDINKFYIEGNDLLGGKYGIATNGISHDDIGAVEVMENHQPMQVLRGLSFSDQAAINLKMKNKSKATFLVHGTLGGGWSQQPRGALWQGDIFSMMVTGKYQMITTLKGNNTGLNLSDQLRDFTSDRPDESMEGYISLSPSVTPNLQRNRSYFNRSWMVSSSHLLKTKKNGELKAQIDYQNDRVTARGTNTTTYFLNSGDRVILEDKNSLSHRSAVTGKFSYEVNEKKYFLNNTLSADFSWNNLTLNTAGTLPNTQSARMPEYSVCNLLKVIRRFGGNKLVTFNSRNEWNSLPERLTVSRDGDDYGQQITQHSFYTDERASLGFVFRRVMLSLEAGVSGYFRNLNTDLWGVDLQELTDREELTTDYLRVFASPKLEWSYKKLELTFNMPVNLYSYFFSGALRNRSEFFISPSLSARFRLTPRMSLALRGSARRSPASLHTIHDSSILTDYRSFSSGIDDYYTSSGQSVSASYNFRNAQSGIFLMAMGSYGWNKSKFGTVQNVVGDYIFHSYRPQPSDSRNAMALLNISKTLDFMRGAVGVRSNYRRSENNLLSQGLLTEYRNDAFSLSPFINGNISTYFNWNLKFTWDRSSLKISDMPGRNTDGFIYSGSVTLTPCSLITWTTGGEYYRNEIEDGRYKDMLMLDTKLSFNISKRVEISASATNLLNKKEYSYTTYGTLSQYERSSRLRGREFMISIYLKK